MTETVSTTPITFDRMIGTWQLIDTRTTTAAGERQLSRWGPEAMGSLVITAAGRMMAVLCDGRETMPEGQKRDYSSYSGAVRLEGDAMITRVEGASDASRIGSDQRRGVRFEGNLLVLQPPLQPDGERRELVWRKID